MEYVTLVNRTSKTLQGTWDGRQHKVTPGEHMLPKAIAEAVKRQNPLMGSQGLEIWDVIYLCGIKEQGDDISPIEQSDIVELVNPALLHAATLGRGQKMQTVPGVAGLYRHRNSVAAELPVSGPNDMVSSGFDRD